MKRDERDACEARLKRSRLPRAFRDGTVQLREVLATIGDVAGCVSVLALGRGLFLYGAAGAQKTRLACSWLAGEIVAGASGSYVYAPDLFTELSEIYAADDARSRADVIERYSIALRFVMDDIDKAKPSRHAAEVLGAIFDYRYREHLFGTIVTSNRSIDDIAESFRLEVGETYSTPLMRRLGEMLVSVPMARQVA